MSDMEGSLAVQEKESALLRVMELSSMSFVPAALKAAVNLDIINILARQQEHGTHLSATQIVALMTSKPRPAPCSVDRILRLLASHGVFSSSLVPSTHLDDKSTNGSPLDQRLVSAYGLNSVSKCLVPDETSGASLSAFLLLEQHPVSVKALSHIEEALVDGGVPFVKAHGKTAFLYGQEDAKYSNPFNRAMSDCSKLFMPFVLDTYHGFEGLESLVDVGGGLGTTLQMIISKHPHIQGINFDLPHVIALAPTYPGVIHVAGDMFVSIPKADAIFMKAILHDWSDEHCLKILKNCYDSLPSKGKVIVVCIVLSNQVDTKLNTRMGYHMDILMFAYSIRGRERTLEELKSLATCAGFSHVEATYAIDSHLAIVEMYKS